MKNIYLSLILLFVPILFYGQTNNYSITDTIIGRFTKQLDLFPQEKIYALNDKPYYITGEDIWFRAFLVNAIYHTPDTTSRYIYAELVNPVDSVVSRVKVRPVNGAYHGYITIAQDLPEGEYYLRFYTRFMQSIEEDFFFKRKVMIGDPLSALYHTNIIPQNNSNKNKTEVELRFTDISTGKEIYPENMVITEGDKVFSNLNPNKNHAARLSLSNKHKKKILKIEYDYDKKFHKQFISVPNSGEDYDVSFHPEGGDIPADANVMVAFKALKSDGIGEDVEGVIVAENGDTLTSFASRHLGMGTFLFRSAASEKYYAICRNGKNVEKRVELPVAKPSTMALQLKWNRSKLNIVIQKSSDIESLPDDLYLIIHTRGIVWSVNKWSNDKDYIYIERSKIPSGVSHVILTTSQMVPLSERLFFNLNNDDLALVSFNPDKVNYKSRQLVDADIKITDIQGIPLSGDFSVTVRDDKDILTDTCNNNILSSLLFTSDLKGYIESPAYYFINENTSTIFNLDILMMTQGWTRYNIPDILKGIYTRPKSYLELGQAISGNVKGGLLMNRKTTDNPVTMFITDPPMFDMTQTDTEGRFVFSGFELPDSTKYIIQATTKKGGNRVELIVDPESYPDICSPIPITNTWSDRNGFTKYMEKAEQKFTTENGMRMIYLKDIEVVASHIEKKKSKSIYASSINSTVISVEDIERMHALNVKNILMRLPGVNVSGDNISIRGGRTPLLLIDDIICDDLERFLDVPVGDIEEITVMKGPETAIFGFRGYNGAILMTTKLGDGTPAAKSENYNIKTIVPLGYQVTKEFYTPRYQTADEINNPTPDLRSTIYWNPSVKTSEKGAARIQFYTADSPSTYSVIIEGITINGQIIRSVEKIRRTD